MPYPRKFKRLLEPDPESVPRPDYLWLAHAVCATESSSCGWEGWVLDGVFRKSGVRYPTSTGDELLPSTDQSACPACGRALFRTGIAVRFERSQDQTPPMGRPGVDFEVGDIEYE